MTSQAPLWLLINLDRSTQRLAAMSAHLQALAVDFTRVPAIDGLTLPPALPGVDPDRFRRRHGSILRGPELGCYISHLFAMRAFLNSAASHAVILEDDIEISPDVVRLVRDLCARDSPADWDMVKLEGHRAGTPLTIRRLFGAYRLSAMLTRTSGAAAYLITRHAATRYLDALLPLDVPIDHAFDRGWALGLRIRAVAPFPARVIGGVNMAASTIATGRRIKVGLRHKAPAIWWRTRTETMRVVSALQAFILPESERPGRSRRVSRRAFFDALEQAVERLGEVSAGEEISAASGPEADKTVAQRAKDRDGDLGRDDPLPFR